MEFLQFVATIGFTNTNNIALFFAIFTRVSVLAFVLPGLGESTVPIRVRLAAALAITFILAPLVMAFENHHIESVSKFTETLAAEAVAGAIIGFSIRIAIFAIQTAGAIIAQSLSLAQLFGSGISLEPESSIATLLMVTGVVLAVSAGLHFEAISVLLVSYTIMPLGMFPGADQTGQWAADRTGFAFAAALSLALPFVVLGFVYNLAIGAANRAMPQLMVAFVGIPAITLAGLALLALSAPFILNSWIDLNNQIITLLLGEAR